MTHCQIRHRYTGNVIFEGEFDNFKQCVEAAVAARSDLRGSDLRYSNLSDSDLSYSDLRGSDLRYSNGNNREVRSVQTGVYFVTYTSDVMCIGCERHAITDWWAFDDERILQMGGKTALAFWKAWKPILQQIIAAAPATPTKQAEAAA